MLIIDIRSVLPGKGNVQMEGWTILPLFNGDGYVEHGFFQLPLFEGTPSRVSFIQLRKMLDVSYIR